MIVDDGAGGTNRKATMDRLATYMGTKIGGGLEFISSSGAISNAATVAFTGFDSSKYDHYVFWLQHIIPATDNVTFWAQSSTDTGSSYSSSSGDYHMNGNNDSIGFTVSSDSNMGSDTNEGGCCGPFYLYAPHNTANYTQGNCSLVSIINASGGVSLGGASYSASYRVAAEDVDAIRFIFSSGNIESGEITMFGIVNS